MKGHGELPDGKGQGELSDKKVQGELPYGEGQALKMVVTPGKKKP